MNPKDTGGPAFPSEQHETQNGEWNQSYEQGMTLRDYFAAKAMQGFCVVVGFSNSPTDEQVAHYSYSMADAMLREREK